MTDEESNAEFAAIIAHAHSRITEQHQVARVLAHRLGVTPEMAAGIVQELDTSKPGQLTRITRLLSDNALRSFWSTRLLEQQRRRELDQTEDGEIDG